MAHEVGPDEEVARTFLQLLAALPVGTETIVTLIHGKATDPDGFRGYRVVLAAALADVFRQLVVGAAVSLIGAELVPFDPGRELLDGEASFRSTDDIPAAGQLMSYLDNPLGLLPFGPQFMDEDPPTFYVVSVRERGNKTERFHAVRRIDARYRLNRRKKLAIIPIQDGSYQELREEPLLLPNDFDAYLSSEIVVVSNQGNVDAIFGLLDAVRNLASETLRTITEHLRFANYEAFERAVVSDLNMLAKLRSIQALAKDPKYRARMTMEQIIEFARQHPHLEIDFEGPEGGEQLLFHSDARRRWRLLRLLDDQFVRSLITELDYEANSKSRLS